MIVSPLPSQNEVDLVAKFLRDINVYLDIDYADAKNPSFQLFMPSFALQDERDLASRLSASFDGIKDDRNRQLAVEVIGEALVRCASSELGTRRSLVVLDVAHHVCRERFNRELWQKLLFRQADTDLPSWLRELVFRFRDWGVPMELSKEQIGKSLKLVHPSGFEAFIRWVAKPLLSEATHKNGSLLKLLVGSARQRLRDDKLAFKEIGLDIIKTRDLIDVCDIGAAKMMRVDRHDTLSTTLIDSFEREELEATFARDESSIESWESMQASRDLDMSQLCGNSI
jgi:hypothetical protein